MAEQKKKKKSPVDEIIRPDAPEAGLESFDTADEMNYEAELPQEDPEFIDDAQAQSLMSRTAAAPAPGVPNAGVTSPAKPTSGGSAITPSAAGVPDDAADKIAKSPTDQLMANIEKNIKVLESEKSTPTDRRNLDWLQKRYDQLNDEYAGEKNSLEWRQVAETVAHALTQLFAAREGMKQGVDMSGLKFDKTDWEKKLAAAQSQRGELRGQAEKLYGEGEKATAAEVARKAGLNKNIVSSYGVQRQILRDKQDQKNQEENRATRLKAAGIAAEAKASKLDRLSDKQVEGLEAFDQGLRQLQEIKAKKSKIDTGPIAAKRNAIARWFGIDDADVTSFRQDLMNQLASRVKEISGSAASEKEVQRLQAAMPTMEMNDEQFIKSLNNFEHELRAAKQVRLQTYKKRGYDLKGWEDEADTQGPSTPSGASEQKGGAEEVERRTKDGKVAIFDKNTKQFIRYKD